MTEWELRDVVIYLTGFSTGIVAVSVLFVRILLDLRRDREQWKSLCLFTDRQYKDAMERLRRMSNESK